MERVCWVFSWLMRCVNRPLLSAVSRCRSRTGRCRNRRVRPGEPIFRLVDTLVILVVEGHVPVHRERPAALLKLTKQQQGIISREPVAGGVVIGDAGIGQYALCANGSGLALVTDNWNSATTNSE